MFDIGPGEIGVLIVLAIIIFGPEKLPEIARQVARVVNYLRHIANDAQSTLRRELGPEYADLDIRDLNPKTFVKKHLLEEVQPVIDDVRQDFKDADRGMREDVEDMKKTLAGMNKDVPAAESEGPAPFDREAT